MRSPVPARHWRVLTHEVGPRGPGPELLECVRACQNAAELADRPGEPPSGEAELRGLLAPPYRGRRLLFTVCDRRGRTAGWARLGLYDAFHQDLAHASITVCPLVRRQGVGSVLFAVLAEAARARGRGRLLFDARRTAGAESFAGRHGLTLSGRDLRSRLDLADPGLPGRLAAAQREQEPPGQRAEGRRPPVFVPVSWSGACPTALMDGYVRALDCVHTGSGPSAPFSGTEVRHREKLAEAAGLREYSACLLDPVNGNIAALSNAHTADGLRAEQNETVVVPAYRGHGLAVGVKARLIARLLSAEPGLTMLDTYNAVDNSRILAANRRLGFRPVDTHATWLLQL